MKRKTLTQKKPVRSHQVPVTLEMMGEMEGHLSHKIDASAASLRAEMHTMKGELTTEIRAMKGELTGEMNSMKSDMSSLRSDMSLMKSDMESMKSEICSMRSDVHSIKSEMHRMALLAEEQNARNKFVRDGYAQLYELIERKLG